MNRGASTLKSTTAPIPPEGAGGLTIAKFCETFGPGRTEAYQLLAEGKLAGVKSGRRTLITRASAERWFASLPPFRAKRAARRAAGAA